MGKRQDHSLYCTVAHLDGERNPANRLALRGMVLREGGQHSSSPSRAAKAWRRRRLTNTGKAVTLPMVRKNQSNHTLKETFSAGCRGLLGGMSGSPTCCAIAPSLCRIPKSWEPEDILGNSSAPYPDRRRHGLPQSMRSETPDQPPVSIPPQVLWKCSAPAAVSPSAQSPAELQPDDALARSSQRLH